MPFGYKRYYYARNRGYYGRSSYYRPRRSSVSRSFRMRGGYRPRPKPVAPRRYAPKQSRAVTNAISQSRAANEAIKTAAVADFMTRLAVVAARSPPVVNSPVVGKVEE